MNMVAEPGSSLPPQHSGQYTGPAPYGQPTIFAPNGGGVNIPVDGERDENNNGNRRRRVVRDESGAPQSIGTPAQPTQNATGNFGQQGGMNMGISPQYIQSLISAGIREYLQNANMNNMNNANQNGGAPEPRQNRSRDDEKKYIVLDEKYFRRVELFDGTRQKFRGWSFDLLVAIGQIDDNLAKELKRLLARDLEEKWDPESDSEVDFLLHDKYKGELYGVLCSLTTGEAKNIVKDIVENGFQQDGYKALALLNKRCENKTTASRLNAFLEVIKPNERLRMLEKSSQAYINVNLELWH